MARFQRMGYEGSLAAGTPHSELLFGGVRDDLKENWIRGPERQRWAYSQLSPFPREEGATHNGG